HQSHQEARGRPRRIPSRGDDEGHRGGNRNRDSSEQNRGALAGRLSHSTAGNDRRGMNVRNGRAESETIPRTVKYRSSDPHLRAGGLVDANEMEYLGGVHPELQPGMGMPMQLKPAADDGKLRSTSFVAPP